MIELVSTYPAKPLLWNLDLGAVGVKARGVDNDVELGVVHHDVEAAAVRRVIRGIAILIDDDRAVVTRPIASALDAVGTPHERRGRIHATLALCGNATILKDSAVGLLAPKRLYLSQPKLRQRMARLLRQRAGSIVLDAYQHHQSTAMAIVIEVVIEATLADALLELLRLVGIVVLRLVAIQLLEVLGQTVVPRPILERRLERSLVVE